MQIFALGTIVLLGALLAVPLSTLGNPLGDTAQQLDLGLFGAEVVLFLLISWLLSRKVLPTVIGLVAGLLARSVAAILIELLLRSKDMMTLFQPHGQYLIVHVLILATACMVLLIPLRGLLISGFTQVVAKGGTASKQQQQFYFSSRPAPTSNLQLRTSPGRPGSDKTHLSPPASFVTSYPRDDVTGLAHISVQLVLESVPEAAPYLKPDALIRVRLSYVVSQLSRGTVWLTWPQVFAKGLNDGAFTKSDYPEADFRDRWIRIPPKYYVKQVAQEYFSLTKRTPSWMRLPEVPQENQLKL